MSVNVVYRCGFKLVDIYLCMLSVYIIRCGGGLALECE